MMDGNKIGGIESRFQDESRLQVHAFQGLRRKNAYRERRGRWRSYHVRSEIILANAVARSRAVHELQH